MPDQADQLRQLIHAAAPVSAKPPLDRGLGTERQAGGALPLVVVAGSRPGVGATTVAMNVAAVLADRGERVLVVDRTEEKSNLLEIAGVRSAGDYSLADVLAGKCEVGDAMVAGPAGTKLLVNHRCRKASREGLRQRQQLMTELQAMRDQFDVVVVDAGAGLSPASRRLWLRARLVLLVTTADDASVMDAYAAMKQHATATHDASCENIRVLVNRAESERIAVDAQRRLSQCCRRFLGCEVTGLGPLPRFGGCEDASSGMWPRVWEAPNSEFGHAMLWLGRTVGDAIASRSLACA